MEAWRRAGRCPRPCVSPHPAGGSSVGWAPCEGWGLLGGGRGARPALGPLPSSRCPRRSAKDGRSRRDLTSDAPSLEPSSLFSKLEETRDESPCSWRLGLRKTGSQNVLSEAAGAREALRDRGASVHRSASSPRISALMDNREKVRCPSVAVQPRGQMETVSRA